MPLKFYTDEHILMEATRQLKTKGIDVLTSQKAGKLGFSDYKHLVYATQQNRILITCDEDFFG